MQPDPIPYGYCQCGCGEKTTISPKTSSHWGWTKGEPRRYLKGHAHPHKLVWGPDLWTVEERGYDTPCWIWKGRTDRLGYGRIRYEKRTRLVHDVSWEIANGAVPDGLELDHLCRNTSCVNPSHLEPVTHAENMRRGEGAKLSYEKAKQIRALHQKGWTHRAIAARYRVSTRTVADTLAGKRWVQDCSPNRCA